MTKKLDKRFIEDKAIDGSKILLDQQNRALKWKASDNASHEIPVLEMIAHPGQAPAELFTPKAFKPEDYSAQNFVYVEIGGSGISQEDYDAANAGDLLSICSSDNAVVGSFPLEAKEIVNMGGTDYAKFTASGVGDLAMAQDPGGKVKVSSAYVSGDRAHMFSAPTVTIPSEDAAGLQTKSQVEQRIADALASISIAPTNKTFYVSKDGSDSNNGSESKPFLTVPAAITAALALSPDATFPALIKVGIGDFNAAITFAPYVFIEGAGVNAQGQNLTKLGKRVVNLAADTAGVFYLKNVGFAGGGNQLDIQRNLTNGIPTGNVVFVLENVAASSVQYYGSGPTHDSIIVKGRSQLSNLSLRAVTALVQDSTITSNFLLNDTGVLETDGTYGAVASISNSVINQFGVNNNIKLSIFSTRITGNFGLARTAPEIVQEVSIDVASYPANGISGSNASTPILISYAKGLGYTPAVAGDYDATHVQAASALDELAARTKTIEENPVSIDGLLKSDGSVAMDAGASLKFKNADDVAVAVLALDEATDSISLRSESSDSGEATGDIVIETGSTSGAQGILFLKGSHVNVADKQLKEVADATDALDAVNLQTMEAAILAIPSADLTPFFKKDGSVAMEGNILADGAATRSIGEEIKPFLHMYSRFYNIVTDLNQQKGTLHWNGTGVNLQSDTSIILAPNVAGGFSIIANGAKISQVATPVAGGDAANKDYVDAETTRAELAEAAIQANLSAVIAGLEWRNTAFIISADPELISATEGEAVSDILPFSDDEAPQIVLADVVAGMYFIAVDGVDSKLMKVYDDAGTLKVTFLGFPAMANKNTFIVVNDLLNSPGPMENRSIYQFIGDDFIKLADVNWSIATGISLSAAYVAEMGTVLPGDSVEKAISKLDGNIADISQNLNDLGVDLAAEISRALAAEGVLQTNIDAKANRTLSNLQAPTAINQQLLPDAPASRSIGDAATYKGWGRVNTYRLGGPGFSVATTLLCTAGQNQVTLGLNIPGFSALSHYMYHPTAFPIGATVSAYDPATGIATMDTPAVTTITVAEAAYFTYDLAVRTENETSPNQASGRTIIRSGNASGAGGRSGNLILSTGTVGAGGFRGVIVMSGSRVETNGMQFKNAADGTQPQDLVTLSQVTTLVDETVSAVVPQFETLVAEVDAGMITNGYFDLPYRAIAKSCIVSLNRLALHIAVDYLVNPLGAPGSEYSRIDFKTLPGAIANTDEAPVEGDTFYVTYVKDPSVIP